MKKMIRNMILAMTLISCTALKPSDPFTEFLKGIWGVPCTFISQFNTSLLTTMGLGVLSYNAGRHWIYDAEDRMYYVKQLIEIVKEYPRASSVVSVLFLISILFNKREENKEKEEKKHQKTTQNTCTCQNQKQRG